MCTRFFKVTHLRWLSDIELMVGKVILKKQVYIYIHSRIYIYIFQGKRLLPSRPCLYGWLGWSWLNRWNCPTVPWKHIKQQWRLARQSRTATSLQTQQLNHKLQNMLTCSHWLTTQKKYEDATFLAVLVACHFMRGSQCLTKWTHFDYQCRIEGSKQRFSLLHHWRPDETTKRSTSTSCA